ncbi:MAG TPA: HIT family protein [Rhodanobacteraceae bacterium]|nr:HIT family protein [Rhodanobacteraceae bacterium]
MSGQDLRGFTLDPRLAADTAFVADWGLSRVLLMDDAQFPWLILVPRREGLVELDDLAPDEQVQLLGEINRAMALLRNAGPCGKLNVGALGNIVRQLHVHIVARHEGDPAWPGPVWGSGAAVRYEESTREALITKLRRR